MTDSRVKYSSVHPTVWASNSAVWKTNGVFRVAYEYTYQTWAMQRCLKISGAWSEGSVTSAFRSLCIYVLFKSTRQQLTLNINNNKLLVSEKLLI